MSNTRARNFSASPALSLTLAGIFRDNGDTESVEGGGGWRATEETMVEISSENSGPGKSDEAENVVNDDDDNDDEDFENNKKNKRKKSCNRHTPEQIKKMEALLKEFPHPDEKQRLELSKELGLNPSQVKFWFQNRRTQIKAIQERHEKSLLQSQIEKLVEENKVLRDNSNNSPCSNCGFATTSKNTLKGTEERQLRMENNKLKAEVEKLRSIIMKNPSAYSSSCTSGTDEENRSSGFCTGIFGLEKPRIMDAVNSATEELKKMASVGKPLWVQSYETGREILNYDEYMKEFCSDKSLEEMLSKKSVEASRESGTVLVNFSWLVQSLMDVNQWKELFPCLISKATTVDVIANGEGANRNGAVHLMSVETQMLTPMVATREVYFVRYSKQFGPGQWAIVDVSIDKLDDNIDASLQKCRKLPSGCIIEDISNSHCKVTWVEHLESQKSMVHSLYRTMVNSGLAFGAKHWISSLQHQCERHLFSIATNVPAKDSSGVATLAGRKNLLKLAQRMRRSFCRALGASSHNSWKKVTSKNGDDIRLASRKNLIDPGEPIGMIMTSVCSVWLPVSHFDLFNFLRDENRRNEWETTSDGSPVRPIANLATGNDRGNAVTVLALKTNKHDVWLLQESSTNAYESMVVYAPVDINGLESVMAGSDSSNIAVLSSGFSILPDGIESRPMVITSRTAEKGMEGGSLLTMASQVLLSHSPPEKISVESLESVITHISSTLQRIKKSLQCEDS